MNKNRKAFTLIEIIFIIVILGILSTAVLTRLATTRDDAKVAFCTQNITLFMRDVSSYYTSQGMYSLDMKNMTNIKVHETTPITSNGSNGKYYYICNKEGLDINESNAATVFTFSKIDDGTGNLRTNLNARATSITQGTVDGDLGYLLEKKNIATTGVGIDHPITGLRTKR